MTDRRSTPFYRLARTVGRTVPFPPRFRLTVRNLLLRKPGPSHRLMKKIANTAEPSAMSIPSPMPIPASIPASLYRQGDDREPTLHEGKGRIKGLVSVLLSVSDRVDLLPQAMDDVLAQSYPNLELILVNDGGSNGIEAVINRYDGDPRVRRFTDADGPMPQTIESGFSMAEGEFWTWTSTATSMEPRMLERLVNILRNKPDLNMAYADQRVMLAYRLIRLIGRILPLPRRIKTASQATFKKHYPQHLIRNPTASVEKRLASSVYTDIHGPMQPECCALTPGLVSVVLPVYNQADLLPQAVDSVLAQTYPRLELILLNDGSDDEVEQVFNRYRHNPRVRCYTQTNQGLPKALSNGFTLAKGEFWTWTSADNIMEPRMLERLTDKLRAEPGLGMVYADYIAIDDRGHLLQDRAWRPLNRPDPSSGVIRLPRTTKHLNTVHDNFIGPSFLYRGWIGRVMGDYAPQMGVEDYDYWMRINTFFPVRHLGSDEPLYRYRVHDNTISAQADDLSITDKGQRLMEYEKIRAAYFQAKITVAADAIGAKWLNLDGIWEQESIPACDDEGRLDKEAVKKAELLIVSSETAAANEERIMDSTTPVAIVFNCAGENCHHLNRLLRRSGCIALASDKITTDRIRLISHCPILDLKTGRACTATVAFAKNHRSFHNLWSEADLLRHPPRAISAASAISPGKALNSSKALSASAGHILLQVDDFVQGGMENVVIDLAGSLSEAGFQTTIAVLGKQGDAADKARDSGLQVESFNGARSPANYVKQLKQKKVDLVNAHYSLFAAEACRKAGIPFIETIHNSYVWLSPQQIEEYRQADPHISAYVCVSNTAAQYADIALGLDVSKMRVIPNGIDSSRLNEKSFKDNRRTLRREWGVPDSAPVFLNVASIMGTKAQLPLVKAFAQVHEQHPRSRLVLLGDALEKPYLQQVEDAASDLGITDNVIFAGYHRDSTPYYHAADVFVLPSYWEGWSLSLAEAMANGLSCVITDVGSAYQFAHHPRVERIPPPFGDITTLNSGNIAQFVYKDDPAFTQSIAKAMLRTAKHKRHPLNTELAQHLDRHRAYTKYTQMFESLLAARKRLKTPEGLFGADRK